MLCFATVLPSLHLLRALRRSSSCLSTKSAYSSLSSLHRKTTEVDSLRSSKFLTSFGHKSRPSSLNQITFCPYLLTSRGSVKTVVTMSDEVAKFQQAELEGGDTIFGKILRKEIPSVKVYEDEMCYAFRDISPQAPVHILLVPRKPIPQLSMSEESDKNLLGHLLYTSQIVAKQEKLQRGFRVVINDGPQGCQSVYHLHLHIIGGRQMNWPPG